jgi:hypothetical protein
VVADRMGVNALARFDRDVIAKPHVDTVIVMIGRPSSASGTS